MNYALVSSDDESNLFECVGLLINSSSKRSPSSPCRGGVDGGVSGPSPSFTLEGLACPILEKMRCALHGGMDDRGKGQTIASLMGNVASLTKGFKMRDLTSRDVGVVVSAVARATECLKPLACDPGVRGRSMVLMHRAVVLVGDCALPYVTQFLEPLAHSCDAEDVGDVAQLMNQLLVRFGGKVRDGIEPVVLPFLRRCANLLPVHGSRSQLELERVNLLKLQVRLSGIIVPCMRIALVLALPVVFFFFFSFFFDPNILLPITPLRSNRSLRSCFCSTSSLTDAAGRSSPRRTSSAWRTYLTLRAAVWRLRRRRGAA